MTAALKWSASGGGRRWSGSEVPQSKYLYFSSLMKFYIVHSSQGLLLLLRGRSLPCRWWADRQALVHWQWDSGNDDQTVTVLSLSPSGHPLLHCWTCWTLHPGHCGELSDIWQPDWCSGIYCCSCSCSWRISQEDWSQDWSCPNSGRVDNDNTHNTYIT